MPRCYLVSLWALLLSLICVGASAQTLELFDSTPEVNASAHVRILEDPSGKLTIADIRQADEGRWTVRAAGVDGDLNFGYSKSAFWLRLNIVAATTMDRWLLEIGFPTLDSVTFYGPLADNRTSFHTGDLLPFAQRPIVHRHFVFPLALEPGKPPPCMSAWSRRAR